mgnify:CR=1 FL=1
MKHTNKNFLYNVIYQVFIFIIPLISTPYISRVLGVDNIGIYSYTYSIVYYFMLGSMLGINNYGAREIAKKSENKKEMSKTFFSIYFLQLFCCFIMILLYFLFISIYNYEYKSILFIQFIYLLSCIFDINWLFFGLEKFKITISRNIIIKTFSLVLIFLLVKNESDLWIYTLVMSISTLISQLYLWIFAKREIKFYKVKIKEIFYHLPKCIILFIPIIAYSIYRVMDKTMIGSMASTIQLGNYESAEKIINIPISFITALGTVMIPHMSKIEEDDLEEKIIHSFNLCFFFIMPMVLGLFIISEDFTIVFFGNEFIDTGKLIILLLPTVVFGGITSVIRSNYLIPKDKDRIYIASTILGAIVNLMLNIIFIKKFGAFGACIGTIFAEFTVMTYQIINTRNNINYKRIISNILSYFIKALIMAFIIFIVGLLVDNIVLRLILRIILAIIIYLLINYKYIIYDFFGISKK